MARTFTTVPSYQTPRTSPRLRLEQKLKTIKRHNLSEQPKKLLSYSAVGTQSVLLKKNNDIYSRQGKLPDLTVSCYLAP